MISLYAAMLVLLGFLLAALLLLVLLPAYRRRIERFATDSVRRALPLTEAEIRADKDRLRAEYALNVHRLEMKLEEAAHSAARQSVEINRRDAKVHDLEQAMSTQQMSVEEHENARRVLEQAILDRLPKVEQRLADTRKLLNQRDKEIALLTETSTAQTSALEEATQINVQQTDELHRVRAALETRAARNRETLGDPRFDGEVALRTEIEMLRAKTRDQAAQIERFHWNKGGGNASSGEPGGASLQAEEIARLTAELGRTEAQLLTLRSSEGTAESGRAALDARLRGLETAEADRVAEVAKLKAALRIYEDGEKGTLVGGENRWISSKAEIGALQAEVDEQRRVIQALRAEIAGSNEKLARQSQHFRNELRRLGSAAPMEGGARRADADFKRPTLAERIAAPRPPPLTAVALMPDGNGTEPAREPRSGGFLKALNGGSDASPASGASDKPAGGTEPAPRRPRLLERISGSADKT